MTTDKTPLVVIQRVCPQCKQRFKVHCRKPTTWTAQGFYRFDCPYCAEPLREGLPGDIFRIERLSTPR